MPTFLKRGALAYLLLTALLSTVAFTLQLRSATLTGLNRTVYASANLLDRPLLDGPAREVSLDFVDAEPDLPARFYVVWRGFWYLPNPRTVVLRAHADDRVTVWLNGQRVLHSRLGETAPEGGRRTLALRAGFHSLAVEYEQLGGGLGIMVHGDGLDAYRLFRRSVVPVDAWLASAAAWSAAAASVLWLTPLVLAGPAATAFVVLVGWPWMSARIAAFIRPLRGPVTVTSSVWGRLRKRFGAPWLQAPDWPAGGLTSARRALPLVFAVFLVSGVLDTLHRYRTRDGFAFGDWLINYQGGFVRRGLLGEVAYQLHSSIGGNPGLHVLWLQLALYAAFLLFSFLLLRKQNLVAYAPLVLAPFMFMYHDEVGFRKEQIFLTFMACSVWLLHTRADGRAYAAFTLLLALYPAAVLSHEMLLLFLPYLLAAWALTERWNNGPRTTWIAVLVCFSAICFSAVLLFGRTAGFGMARILESLASAGYPVGGAIGTLNDSLTTAYAQVKEVFVRGNYVNYVPATLLVAIGFLSIRDRLRAIVSNRACLALVIVSVALSAPLFAFAHDWGRFIRAHAVAIFLLSLGVRTVPRRDPGRKAALSFMAVGRAAAWSVAILIYVSFWRLPPYGDVSILVAEPYYVSSLRRSLALLAPMVD